MTIEKKNKPQEIGVDIKQGKLTRVRIILIFVGTLLLLPIIMKFCFNYDGPYSGRVVDAETGQPIEGAQVKIWADYSNILGGKAGKMGRFGQTDSDGRYRLGALYKFSPWATYGRYFVIYKKGYVAFSTVASVGSTYNSHSFKNKSFEIRLIKWDDTKLIMHDHVEQIYLIDCRSYAGEWERDPKRAEQHRAFCHEAREEMIVACFEKYKDSEFPRTREECEKYADRNLGILKEGSN